MPIPNRQLTLVLMVVLVLVQCAASFAFQFQPAAKGIQTTPSWQLPATAPTDGGFHEDSHSPPAPDTYSNRDAFVTGGNSASASHVVGGALSRRTAVGTGLSVLTTAATATAWAPVSGAASSDNDNDKEPFRVLFAVRIDSTKPDELSEIEIEVRPDWAPLAAKRFRELVELGYYKDAPFFRVLPGYVAQFGIASDPSLNKQWMYCDTSASEEEQRKLCRSPLPDEPRTQPNKRGTLSFASSGKNSRRTQVFINLANNDGPPNFLDAQGFVPFARIVRGMGGEGDTNNVNVPKALNSEYGGKVNQGKAAYYGGEYFRAVFPRLSVIQDARIL